MNKVDVFIENKKVGTIGKAFNSYYFEYDSNWLKTGFSISPLSLPLREGVFKADNNVCRQE